MLFNALFGKKDCSQIVQEDIPHYIAAVWKPKNKVEIQKASPIFSFLFFLCSLHKQENANELSWGMKKAMNSDIKTQTKQITPNNFSRAP